MAPIPRDDPYPAYRFQVTVIGVAADGSDVRAEFAEVSAPTIEVPSIEYRAGSDDLVLRKIPGVPKRTNLTLKRGVTGHTDFWQWMQSALEGRAPRRDGAIALLDETGIEVMRWEFKRALPTKFTGPALSATKNELAMEQIDLAVETLRVVV
ncbi:phage tail protein [Streptomyces canus]|uniref:phage tail protein n=1 Tax=Streptomyces canus TaxID=58343 RepID=UPI0036B9C3EF